MRVIHSLIIAFSTYSRIPMPQVEWSENHSRYVMCFFPLIGAVIGLLLWFWLYLCDILSIGPLLRGAVSALLPPFISGGIHMDGFMDTCDALASWQSRERRLEILRDSHVGAFAVMGCCGYLLISAALFSEADIRSAPLLAVCFVLSRTMSAWVMTVFKSARPEGTLGSLSRMAHRHAVGASSAAYAALCVAAWFLLDAWMAPACAAAAALCLLAYRRMAYRYFGGVTGDLAGWFVQMTELCLTAVIILGGKL